MTFFPSDPTPVPFLCKMQNLRFSRILCMPWLWSPDRPVSHAYQVLMKHLNTWVTAMLLSDRWGTGQIIGVTRSTLLSICCDANDNVEIQVTKVMRSHSAMGRHFTLYRWPDALLPCVMSNVTRKWRRCEMTEMSVIVSISSCCTENWGEAILPIDDSVDVRRSDFDPRYVFAVTW